jgi:hypothetical protein
VFDVSFFILITIVGLNVVFGIIVDTFSELRKELNTIEDAVKNECFVCSLLAHDEWSNNRSACCMRTIIVGWHTASGGAA